jgi:hypothetical protein
MSENLDKELKELLGSVEHLHEVPPATSVRFEKTLDELVRAEAAKKRWFSAQNSFALAAGFLVVIGLGVAVTSDENPINVNSPSRSSVGASSNADVLTSNDPSVEKSQSGINFHNSQVEYSSSLSLKDLPFTPATVIGTSETANKTLESCLRELGLLESVSDVDMALYQDEPVSAIWSPIALGKWQVSIVDQNCQPLDELLIQ